MPRRSATVFAGVGWSVRPRPRGLSGRVRSSLTSFVRASRSSTSAPNGAVAAIVNSAIAPPVRSDADEIEERRHRGEHALLRELLLVREGILRVLQLVERDDREKPEQDPARVEDEPAAPEVRGSMAIDDDRGGNDRERADEER